MFILSYIVIINIIKYFLIYDLKQLNITIQFIYLKYFPPCKNISTHVLLVLFPLLKLHHLRARFVRIYCLSEGKATALGMRGPNYVAATVSWP